MRERGHAFHQQTVARIEAGERPLRLSEAFDIADLLGVPVARLGGSSESDLAADRRARKQLLLRLLEEEA